MTHILPQSVARRHHTFALSALLALAACAEPNSFQQAPPLSAPDILVVPDGTPDMAFGYPNLRFREETRLYVGDVAYRESYDDAIGLSGPGRTPEEGYWRVQDGTNAHLVAVIAAEKDAGPSLTVAFSSDA